LIRIRTRAFDADWGSAFEKDCAELHSTVPRVGDIDVAVLIDCYATRARELVIIRAEPTLACDRLAGRSVQHTFLYTTIGSIGYIDIAVRVECDTTRMI